MNKCKYILILIFCVIPSVCFAAETVEINLGNNYIVTTEDVVISAVVSNSNIISISPFFTIFNEKNVLLLHPKKIGKSYLNFVQDKKETVFEITVKPKNTQIPIDFKKNGFNFSFLDKPPKEESFELDPPPLYEKGGK